MFTDEVLAGFIHRRHVQFARDFMGKTVVDRGASGTVEYKIVVLTAYRIASDVYSVADSEGSIHGDIVW